jgi:hypothetical protein
VSPLGGDLLERGRFLLELAVVLRQIEVDALPGRTPAGPAFTGPSTTLAIPDAPGPE